MLNKIKYRLSNEKILNSLNNINNGYVILNDNVANYNHGFRKLQETINSKEDFNSVINYILPKHLIKCIPQNNFNYITYNDLLTLLTKKTEERNELLFRNVKKFKEMERGETSDTSGSDSRVFGKYSRGVV